MFTSEWHILCPQGLINLLQQQCPAQDSLRWDCYRVEFAVVVYILAVGSTVVLVTTLFPGTQYHFLLSWLGLGTVSKVSNLLSSL